VRQQYSASSKSPTMAKADAVARDGNQSMILKIRVENLEKSPGSTEFPACQRSLTTAAIR